jgi:hypothetical protein
MKNGIKNICHFFKKDISKEMKILANYVYNENENWHNLKTPKRSRCMIKNRENKEFVCHYFYKPKKNVKFLWQWMTFYNTRKSVDILIYDGLMIRKDDFNEELMKQF